MKTEQMLERAAGGARQEEREGPAGPAIRVRTFGEFSVTIDGRELSKGDWQRKRARDLFKLLLLHHGTAMTIDEMVETLWGGLSERNVELLVMNAISHIRKALDPGREPHKPSSLLTSSDRTYTLDLGEGAAIDFIRFRKLVTDARRSPMAERRRALYMEAAHLYRGEFLKEDLYESWTAETRHRLQDMLAEALAYLAGEHLREGDLDKAIATARRLIESDPTSEGGYEILLEALRRRGHMAELLKAFNECTRAFRAELGVEPPERLRRLADPL
jgi:DNA-binding SARP family transcriptional activator